MFGIYSFFQEKNEGNQRQPNGDIKNERNTRKHSNPSQDDKISLIKNDEMSKIHSDRMNQNDIIRTDNQLTIDNKDDVNPIPQLNISPGLKRRQILIDTKYTKDSFTYLTVIGKGSFGKVCFRVIKICALPLHLVF